ncbi:MAG: nucleoside hydrolase [Pseudomonadota bacterium]
MRKILIDTDPGIDDAMAIHLAFAHPGLEVVGLTSVFGNVHLPIATRNALHLAEMAACPCPVAAGAAAPLVQPLQPPAYFVHGTQGFGSLPAARPSGTADPRSAAAFIVDTINADPGEIWLCPVGPLTNIALALRIDPSIASRVAGVVIMGGAVEANGNVTRWAEANIWNDPHAAAEVFAADWPITLVGLDVTETVRCSPGDFAGLAAASPVIGGFLNDAVQFYFQFHREKDVFDGCFMHDPSAVLAVSDPDFFQVREVPIRVVTEGEQIARTAADPDAGTRPVRVCLGVDAPGVRTRFLDIVSEADACRAARIG